MDSTSRIPQETQAKIELAVIDALNYVRKNIAPHRTWNLAMNATKVQREGEDGDELVIEIYVDEGSGDPKQKAAGVAPYMKYTNENWSQFHPPLQGKKNPNEGWWQKACEYIIHSVANTLGGDLNVE